MELTHAFVGMTSLKSSRPEIQVGVDAVVPSPKSIEKIKMLEIWAEFI